MGPFRVARAAPLVAALLSLACVDDPTSSADVPSECSIPAQLLVDGGPGKDGIPALRNPELVPPTSASVAYLLDSDRVIGLVVDGNAIAVPLNVLWWHEIVNFDFGETRLAVTHCPLTGSSLVFDRLSVDGAEFGVSGLLFMNNLVMYDRRAGESLWPQMMRGARCGRADGTRLPMVASLEMTWAGWKALHPQTTVVTGNTGFPRNYRSYPYGDYRRIDNPTLLAPIPRVDTRRPPKELVLGIPSGADAGLALPFGTLAAIGPVAAVHVAVDARSIVVFWDASAAGAAAFSADTPAGTLTFKARNGRIDDVETGSTWRLDGRAINGPLAGTQLIPIADAYASYWFAWHNFHPGAALWTGN
ncbi:MAG: DUF3179 domain-containing protein [Gemmatimonadaceae bacterium]